jgi:hypothetical protein
VVRAEDAAGGVGVVVVVVGLGLGFRGGGDGVDEVAAQGPDGLEAALDPGEGGGGLGGLGAELAQEALDVGCV